MRPPPCHPALRPRLAAPLLLLLSIPGAVVPAAQPASSASATVVLGPWLAGVDRHSLTIRWETDVAIPSSLSWGRTPGLGSVAGSDLATTRHAVTLTGLEAGATIWYSIENGGPQPAATRGEGDADIPARVAVFGDTRSGDAVHASIVADVVAAAPELALHTGDLVNVVTETDWQSFFSIEAPLLATVPLLAAPGNHEGDQVRFRQLLEPAGAPGYYASRWKTLGILVVDTQQSFVPGSAQYQFVEDRLLDMWQDPGVLFTVVLLHHGPYDSGAGHGSNLSAREHLVPLFESYGVDLAFSGHNHDYERSTVNGIAYVVTGGGGAPLYAVRGDWWTQISASKHHYCILEVAGGRLRMTVREGGTGSVIDELEITRRQGECTLAQECSSLPALTCSPPDLGSWVCVDTTCVWTCRAGPPAGDVNGDTVVNVLDAFYLVNYLFAAGSGPAGAADLTLDGAVNVQDVFYLLNYLFAAGPAPASSSLLPGPGAERSQLRRAR